MRRGAPLVGLLAALGCAQLEYESRLDETPPAARHAVHSDRIRQLMLALDRLDRERLPQAMDVAQERERRLADVGHIALEMAESAGALAELGADLGLAPPEQAAFQDYADELERQTRELAARAPDLAPARLRGRVTSIRAVCDGCHAHFRIPPEPE